MNLKIVIFLLFTVSASVFLSGCTSVERKASEEVVFESKTGGSTDEVYISNADVKNQDQQTSFSQTGSQLGKRMLFDGSQVETLVDGFGNKIETRYFKGHPRLRMLILRTSVNGKRELTVYGHGSDTKLVPNLADLALTASGDEIANAAQLFATPSSSSGKNFMKKRKMETTLQPLPSSAFQQPVGQYNQPVEPVQTEPVSSSETSTVQQNQSKEY